MRICEQCGETYDDGVAFCPKDGSPTVAPADPMVGRKIGSYVLVKRIGRGGMGSVYLGLHPVIQSRVAVKILNTSTEEDPDQFARFVTEAKAVNRIHHPNIVSITDLNVLEDGRPYVLMEYLEGGTLRQRLSSPPHLGVEQARSMVVQILDGLQAAHQAGFVHRDLKPENIFITVAGSAKILDFGIAKLLYDPDNPSRTQTGAILGTPMYLSPEQARGDVSRTSPQTDLYAMGVILYEMHTGLPPFNVCSIYHFVVAHMDTPPILPSKRNPSVTTGLEKVILWCLEKDPAARPQSADILKQAFVQAHEEYSRALLREASDTTLPGPGLESLQVAVTPATAPTVRSLSNGGAASGQSALSAPSAHTSNAQSSGTVVVLLPKKTNTFDPVKAIVTEDTLVVNHTHEPLFRYDRFTGETTPCLAAAWSRSGNEYTFELRTDVRFHDGSPMTAESVATSLVRALQSSLGKGFLWDLETAVPTGPHEVKVRTIKPSGSFLTRVSLWPAYIAAPGDPFPPGTGPFKVINWNPTIGASILAPHNDYWGPHPRIEKIVFRTITDVAARVETVLQGRADLAVEVLPEGASMAEKDPSVRVVRASGGGCTYMFINTDKPYLAHPEIRRAIAAAIDVGRLNDTIFRATSRPASGFLPPIVSLGDSVVRAYTHDPGQAQKVLDRADLKNRILKLILMANRRVSNPDPEAMGQFMAETFQNVGLTVEPLFVDYEDFISICASGQHDFCIVGLAVDYPDPESLFMYFASDTLSGYNFSHYSDPEFDRTLDLAKEELDPKRRLEILAELDARLKQTCPAVPLVTMMDHLIVRRSIKNIDLSAELAEPLFSLAGAWVESL